MDRQVLKLMQRIEKALVRLVVLGVLTLLVVQLVLARAQDPMDFYLAFAQKIETVPLEQADASFEPNLILTVEGGEPAHLKVLVNGQEAGRFVSGKLSLRVRPGDRLALDARQAPKGLRLKVSGIGQELAYPRLNQVWPAGSSIIDLGEVKSK